MITSSATSRSLLNGPIPIQNEVRTPVSMGDSPSGIVLSPNATQSQIDSFDRAIGHLNLSTTFQSLWQSIHASQVTFTVVFIDTAHVRFNPQSRNIYWNPYQGLVMTNGAVQNAALGLAHEMAHALQYLEGDWCHQFGQFSMTMDEAEADVLARFETPIARELGQPTRANYRAVQGVRTMNNSTHFVTVHSRSLRDQIVYGLSRQYSIYHNFWADPRPA